MAFIYPLVLNLDFNENSITINGKITPYGYWCRLERLLLRYLWFLSNWFMIA